MGDSQISPAGRDPVDSKRPDALHSADFLDEEGRDAWWNADFLELMGRRLRLEACRSVLDCGCRGHWSRALSVALSSGAEVVGIDREPEWIAEASAAAQSAGQSRRFRFQQGLVEDLPFADASFDLVTCQTLLIHVPDPHCALREMLRVLSPGGLLLVAEPNNLAQCLKWNSLTFHDFLCGDTKVDELLALARFHLLCEKGKHALGEGFNSLGDLLPGCFAELGLADIQAFQSDKAAALFPPYDTPEQRADVADMLRRIDEARYVWREEEARRYFVAGGGSEAQFADFWNWALADNARVRDALKRGLYHAAGGFNLYLVAGRKSP
jgi:ubiquinone/menaquinone biosynthesis C-methylase UbiE